MIKYFDLRNPGDGWRILPKEYKGRLTIRHFKNYDFNIDGTVYNTWNAKFTLAYEKTVIWETLHD